MINEKDVYIQRSLRRRPLSFSQQGSRMHDFSANFTFPPYDSAKNERARNYYLGE